MKCVNCGKTLICINEKIGVRCLCADCINGHKNNLIEPPTKEFFEDMKNILLNKKSDKIIIDK